MTIPRGPTLWPDRTVAKLTFTDYDTFYVLGVSSFPLQNGTLTYYRMNAPLSPNGSTVGVVVPAGFSEYSALYSKYRVIASSIRCEFDNYMNGATGGPDPGLLGPVDVWVAPYTVLSGSPRTFGPNPTAAADVKQGMGNPYSKHCQLAHVDGGLNQRTLYNYISMEKAVGSSEARTSDSYAGLTGNGNTTAGTNPSSLTYWLVGACIHSEFTPGQGNVTILASVTYWVEFYGRDFEVD